MCFKTLVWYSEQVSRMSSKYFAGIRVGVLCGSAICRRALNIQEYDRIPSAFSDWFDSDMGQMLSCVKHKVQNKRQSGSTNSSRHESSQKQTRFRENRDGAGRMNLHILDTIWIASYWFVYALELFRFTLYISWKETADFGSAWQRCKTLVGNGMLRNDCSRHFSYLQFYMHFVE